MPFRATQFDTLEQPGSTPSGRSTSRQPQAGGNSLIVRGAPRERGEGWGIRLSRGSVVHDVSGGLTNLTDKNARHRISSLKEILPLAGRDIRVNYKILF